MSNLFAKINNASRQLFDLLLAPIRDMIEDRRTLVIMPDGALYYLPFETLLTRSVSASGDLSGSLLLQKEILYAPSASVLGSLKKAGKEAKPAPRFELLAYGNPVYEPAEKVRAATQYSLNIRGLYLRHGIRFPPIPRTQDEVLNIAALYPEAKRMVRLREQASESSLKRDVNDRCKILHIAAHGLIDEQAPARSGIVLSSADEDEDGILQIREVFDLELGADLVVLSACHTGLGKLISGEGMVGFVWAFISAGAQSLIVSLWQVNDEFTAELMKRFYKYLRAGRSETEALRMAKIEMIGSDVPAYRHPYFWAPFVFVGYGE